MVLVSNRYLITCTDYFSKWPEAQALPSKCAEGVAKFVLSLITRFGCFKVCISDQSREFVNSLNTASTSKVGENSSRMLKQGVLCQWHSGSMIPF